LITVDYELRDSAPYRINEYLTAGSKSIPKLIIKSIDSKGEDLATWGPRPVACQELLNQLNTKGADFEQKNMGLQNWYNNDKGKTLQDELTIILSRISPSTA